MTNKDEMTMNSDKNAYFLSLPEITELSVPPKTILLEEGKVALVPGEAFYAPYHLRVSYANSMENLQRGMDRVEAALAKLK